MPHEKRKLAEGIGPFMSRKRCRAELDQLLQVSADNGTDAMVVCSIGDQTIRQEWSRYALTSWCRSVLRWLGEGE